jgi:hypothetical protein
MEQRFVPAGPILTELKKQAEACEKQELEESEPQATKLRDKAKLLRKRFDELTVGPWTAAHPTTPPDNSR